MAAITYGTSKIDGTASFRIPFGLFFIVPIIVAVGAWFMVEVGLLTLSWGSASFEKANLSLDSQSPRWLLVKERHEDALASLLLYRKGRFTEDEIMQEYQESVAMINALNHDKGTFKEMWQGVNLKRSLIAIGANVCIQTNGQTLSSKYGTIFLRDIHGPNAFQMYFISSGISLGIILLAMGLFDRIGRKCVFPIPVHGAPGRPLTTYDRPLLLIGSFAQASTFFAIGGIGTMSQLGKGAKIAVTALLTVNFQGHVFGWGPIYHIISGEVPSSRM